MSLLRRKRRSRGTERKKIHLDNIDIREVLDDLGIYYAEEGKNVSKGWIGVTCPFCDDQTNHLGINVYQKTISCFKCGTTGNIIKYLTEHLGSFNKAINILGDAVPRELKTFEGQSYERAIKVELPSTASRKITEYHAGFLDYRNFDWKTLSDMYNLHYCGPIGSWRNRIIAPVVHNYRLITFTSIDISDETEIRYKHLSDELSIIPIKHYLYGLDQTDGHSVIVTEGIFDMMRIGPGAVCTFGTKFTPEQVKLLSKFSSVKVVFDGDEAGIINGEKLANALAPFCDVKLFTLPDGDDPDKLSLEDIEQIRNS